MRASAGLTSILAATLCATTASLAAERELGAHEHGHGTVNVAVEGSTVWIELEAPGADIVGFEHAPRTDEDKAAMDAAKARLAAPLDLFAFPDDAACVVGSATVEAIGHDDPDEDHDEHGHDHDEESDEDGHEDVDGHEDDSVEEHDDHDHADDAEEGHSEFHARYTLDCSAPDRIDEIGFPYFTLFPGAEELTVNVVTDSGQGSYDVDRDEPVVRLMEE